MGSWPPTKFSVSVILEPKVFPLVAHQKTKRQPKASGYAEMFVNRAQELSPFLTSIVIANFPSLNPNPSKNPMRTYTFSSFSFIRLFRPLSHTQVRFLRHSTPRPPPTFSRHRFFASSAFSAAPVSFVDEKEGEEKFDFSSYENEAFAFEDGDGVFAGNDMKHLIAPEMEVKELEELPEQWRRSKLAWLCKELPAHKAGTLVRILNAQRKWMTQEDATYLAVHCMRIRENETGFRVLILLYFFNVLFTV